MTQHQTSALQLLDFDDAEAGILAYALDEGKLTEEDTAPIWQRFDDAKKSGKKVRVYCEYHAAPTPTGGMIFEKMKRLGTIFSTLERMAIVGDKAWMAIYEKVVNPLTKPDIRHFTTDQRDEAIAWVRG